MSISKRLQSEAYQGVHPLAGWRSNPEWRAFLGEPEPAPDQPPATLESPPASRPGASRKKKTNPSQMTMFDE